MRVSPVVFSNSHTPLEGLLRCCRACRSKQRKEDDRELCAKATKTLLLRLARDINAGRCTAGHAEVIGVLASLLGGAEGIGLALAKILHDPRTKSRTALTVLNSVVSMAERLEPARQARVAEHDRQVSQMAKEELEEYVLETTDRLLRLHGLKIVPIEDG